MPFGLALFISVVYATTIFLNIWFVRKMLFRWRVNSLGVDVLWIHLAADMKYAVVRISEKGDEFLVVPDDYVKIDYPIPDRFMNSILLHERLFECHKISENEYKYVPNRKFFHTANKKYNALCRRSKILVRQYEGFPLFVQRSLEEEYFLIKKLYEELSEDSDRKKEEE